MSVQSASPRDVSLVSAQLGREPRTPWRVVARCVFGRPQVIASPALLDDGTPFPNLFWLTCPHIAEGASADESAGATARWASLARSDSALAAALAEADAQLRRMRRAEGRGEDACADVGIAGQRDPLGVKCLHAHAALALAGVEDPIGDHLLGKIGRACRDDRCARLGSSAPAGPREDS